MREVATSRRSGRVRSGNEAYLFPEENRAGWGLTLVMPGFVMGPPRRADGSSALKEKHLRGIAARIPMNASEDEWKVGIACSLVKVGEERWLEAESLCERIAEDGKLRLRSSAFGDEAYKRVPLIICNHWVTLSLKGQ